MQRKIDRDIWINASRERVWEALTDADQIEKWFSPGTAWQFSSLEVGGVLFVYDEKTDSQLYAQVLLVVDPPARLVLRTQEPPPFTTTYQLVEENSGTRLQLTYSGYEALPEDIGQKDMDRDAGGFIEMLGNIKAFIEGTALPRPGGF